MRRKHASRSLNSADVTDYRGDSSTTLVNVLPRAGGYAPFKSFVDFTSALPATCRSFFYARKTDGSIAVFARHLDQALQAQQHRLHLDRRLDRRRQLLGAQHCRHPPPCPSPAWGEGTVWHAPSQLKQRARGRLPKRTVRDSASLQRSSTMPT